MSQPIFALVDCNNFYASCEKLFRPDIVNTPVVVLSNNDGCVVARSKEAKKMGIKMGVPIFQIKELIHKQGVLAFSSNYALYADMSQRVMSTLESLAPRVEVYSIDEAFLDLTSMTQSQDLTAFGIMVRQIIQKWIGITVCVGIAPTKTLSKLANHAAKTWHKTDGVVDLTSKVRQRKLLALLPVNEVCISRTCKKFRQEQQAAKHLTVFMRTSPFSDTNAPYSASISIELDLPSSDTSTFLNNVIQLLNGLRVNGYR